ncbi:syntaxin-8 [Prorops nasuta]|uniref:syntaxin-8 n=1 Tax=Prorops nasuta TaxID=863751 RepID=UPI0034D00922
MALVYIDDNDPWLMEYDACERLFREIMELLTSRDKESKVTQVYANLSATIRLRMKQYSHEVQILRNKIIEDANSRTITAEEAERRTRKVELLQSKDVQLQTLYESNINKWASSRDRLLRVGSSALMDGGTTSWAGDDDDVHPIEAQVSINDLKVHQEQILQDQEQGLEELCKVISRQKQIGQAIYNEVDHQNEIIDDLAEHMDRTDDSIVHKTHQVQSIGAKDHTCGYWVIILLLFICIIAASLT